MTRSSGPSLVEYVRRVGVPALAALTLLATFVAVLQVRPAYADASTCYIRAAYQPWVDDGPSTGDAYLKGSVYLECSTAESRTVSAYLWEDLYLRGDAYIARNTWTDYDTWHRRTVTYGPMGYDNDGDTQEYYTVLRFYDPVVGSNSPDYQSSRLSTHYTWRP